MHFINWEFIAEQVLFIYDQSQFNWWQNNMAGLMTLDSTLIIGQFTQFQRIRSRRESLRRYQKFKQFIYSVNNKSMQKQQSSRFQNWLAYTPLLYNQLSLFSASEIKEIGSLKWLHTMSNVKSFFKFQEGYLCVGGSTAKTSISNNKEGGFAVYKVILPTVQELDDERLAPTIKCRSFWRFKQEIQLIEQSTPQIEGYVQKNIFAISSKKYPIVYLIPANKMTSQGNHSEYAENDSIKLEGHKLPITCMKWTNFGHSCKILTSSLDYTIIQWDLEKRAMERQLVYHKSSVEGLTPLHDFTSSHGDNLYMRMQTFASASTDGTILIWDQKSPTPVTKINPAQKQLSAIDCFSKNMIVSGGEEGSIKIFDLRQTRQYLYDCKNDKVPGHTGKIKEIKVNRQHRHEARYNDSKISERIKFTSSGMDGKVIEWQQKIQFVHEGHENAATLDLSDRHKLCASAELNKNVVMLWESGVSLSQSQN